MKSSAKTKKTDKHSTRNSKKSRVIIFIASAAFAAIALCIGGLIYYKNTPQQKVLHVGSAIMSSMKSSTNKTKGLVNLEVEHKLLHNSYSRASAFKYTLDNIKQSPDSFETYKCYNLYESDEDFENDIKKDESAHPTSDGWTEDKSVDDEVTFKSNKYKVKNYVLTYSVDYTIDGTGKIGKVYLNIQEQSHGKGNYEAVGLDEE